MGGATGESVALAMACRASRERAMRGSRAAAAREGRGATTNLCCSRYLALGRAFGSYASQLPVDVQVLMPAWARQPESSVVQLLLKLSATARTIKDVYTLTGTLCMHTQARSPRFCSKHDQYCASEFDIHCCSMNRAAERALTNLTTRQQPS